MIYTSLYTPQWDRYQRVGLPWRGLWWRHHAFGSGYEKGLSWRVNDYLAGVGEEGGTNSKEMIQGMWKYCEVIRDHKWMNHNEYSFKSNWFDFNLELNVVLDVLIWAGHLFKGWAWIPPASTCTVQKWLLPGQQKITALGGWNFRDFGALWFKVPCSISDFNGNIIDVFIIWCFFLLSRFFQCCCVQSQGLLIKRRTLEVIMKDNMTLCDIVPQCGVVVLVGVVAVVYIRARVNTEAQKTPWESLNRQV